MNTKNNYVIPFILVTCLFFLWAFLHNINGTLIPHLRKACQLTDTQTSYIDIAVSLGYFILALPAGWFMHKFGYKNGVLLGLLLFGCGLLLFIPAANGRTYSLFLTALFIAAAGATILETVANPYVTKLGDPSTTTQRLNLAQSFNGVGAFIAPLIGARFILSGKEYTKAELAAMPNDALQAYLQSEADTVKTPYLIIGIAVLVLLALFYVSKLPEIKEDDENGNSKFTFSVLKNSKLRWSVIAQFFYVGAQACNFSFFIRYAKYTNNISEKSAGYMWSAAMIGFMLGRFVGTFLMQHIKPIILLFAFSLVNILLTILAITSSGDMAVYATLAIPFFMSIMFPTIFGVGIDGLGKDTKIGASFLVMAIIGGAIFPYLMGQIMDATKNIKVSYVIPLICFAAIAIYAYAFRDTKTATNTSSH